MRTAGVITRDGASAGIVGAVPCIQVFEIGTLSSKRHPTDILPFLPMFRPYLQSLPNRVDDMSLRVCKVPLSDLECVTNTQVKITKPMWYLNIKKGKSIIGQICTYGYQKRLIKKEQSPSSGPKRSCVSSPTLGSMRPGTKSTGNASRRWKSAIFSINDKLKQRLPSHATVYNAPIS